MTVSKQPERKSRPWVGLTITFVLLGLAVQSQLSRGHIDNNLLTALAVFGAGWAGWGIDRWKPFQ